MSAPHQFRCRVLSALAASAGLLLALLGPYAVPAAAGPSEREVLRAVHTDALHVTYDGGRLGLLTRIGTGETRVVDPATVVFNLEDKPSARLEVPDLPALSFLGTPGQIVWTAPETQDPELIWPGWDTEQVPAGVLDGDSALNEVRSTYESLPPETIDNRDSIYGWPEGSTAVHRELRLHLPRRIRCRRRRPGRRHPRLPEDLPARTSPDRAATGALDGQQRRRDLRRPARLGSHAESA